MNFSNIKNLYKKHQLAVTLVVGTFLFFISTFWNPAIYIASVFILVSYIFSSIEDIFAYSFYFMLFSGIIVFYVVLAVGTFLVVFVKYIADVIKEKAEVHKKPLLATTVIVAIYSLIHYKLNDYGIFQGLLIIGLMYLIYVMFCYRKQISIRKLFKVMCIGMIATSLLSLLLYFCSSAEVFVFDNFDYTFRPVKEKVLLDVGGQYKRLELFSYHPNHLASFCMFLIAYAVYTMINNKQEKTDLIENIVMLSVGIIVGLLTLSKAFFIIFALEIVFVFVYLIIQHKKQSLKFVIPIALVIIVGALVFHKQIAVIIKRLLPNGTNTSLDDLTTGRVGIWIKFIDELLSSPIKLIFGEGLFTTDIVDIGPHSIYIAILFRFGIVGTVALGWLIYTYIISVDSKLKLHFRKILPIVVFLVYSIQEANIDERFFFFIIAVILLFAKTDKDDSSEFEPISRKKEKKLVEIGVDTKTTEQNQSETAENTETLNNQNSTTETNELNQNKNLFENKS